LNIKVFSKVTVRFEYDMNYGVKNHFLPLM